MGRRSHSAGGAGSACAGSVGGRSVSRMLPTGAVIGAVVVALLAALLWWGQRRGSVVGPVDSEDLPEPVQGSFEEMAPLEALMKWLTSIGGSLSPKVEASYCGPDRGYCLASTATISKGDKLLTVPRGFTLSLQGVRQLKAVQLLQQLAAEQGWNLQWTEILTLGLLVVEDKSGDLLRPWLELLPREHHIPAQWSQQELDAIQFTDLHRHQVGNILPFVDSMLDHFQELSAAYPRHFPESMLSREKIIWAFGTINSRGFETGGPLGSDSFDVSLIPVVDLLNHNEGGMPIHVRPSDDGHNVTWVAQSDWPAGKEILLRYNSEKPNDYWLGNYGFLLPNNPQNVHHLYFAPSPETDPALATELQAFMQQEDIPNWIPVLRGQIPKKLLMALRFSNTPGASRLTSFHKHSPPLIEMAVVDTVSSMCDSYLTKIPGGSAEDDERELSSAQARGWTRNMQLAVQYRMEVKKILQGLKNQCLLAYITLKAKLKGLTL